MAVVVVAVAVLMPLLIAPGLSFYFDITPKVAVLVGGAAIALLALAARPGRVAALLATAAGRWLAVLLAASLAALIFSTAWSTDPALSLYGSSWRRFGLLNQAALLVFTFAAACWLASESRRAPWILLRAVAAAGSVAALYGILQYFGIDPLLPAPAYRTGEGVWTIVRPPGTLGHAAYFAAYLLTAVFAGAALLLADGARNWKAVGALACGLGSIAIVLSGTRAAIVGLAVGAAILAGLARPRFTWRLAACAALLALMAGAFYYSPAGTPLRARVRWSREDALGGARLHLWRDSLRMARQRLLTGYGPETFVVEFPRFQSVALARAYPDFYHESPHNLLLDALTGTGVGGLAVMLGFAALGFRSMLRAAAPVRNLAGAVGAGLAATLVTHQFACFVLPTALSFYLAVALLVALPPQPARSCSAAALWRSLLVLPVSILLAIVAVRLVWADHLLERTRQALDAGRLADAVRLHAGARAGYPGPAASDLWFSRRLAAFAQKAPDPGQRLLAWQVGLQTAERAALSAENRPNALYSLAGFYAAQNDFPRTEASLRAANARAPNWFKPHWMLAQVLLAGARLEEAEREAVIAARLNGGRNPEVAATLNQLRMRRHGSGL